MTLKLALFQRLKRCPKMKFTAAVAVVIAAALKP
jgi:hypothetical protein